MTEGKRVTIIGAGLAGSLLARALGRRGYRVRVFERRPDPRAAGFVGGRSINLALSCRGITALAEEGLADRVLEDAIPMRGRMMHDTHGSLHFQAYSKRSGDAINSVSRAGLNITLIDAADEHDNVSFHFGTRFVDADLDRAFSILKNEQTGEDVFAEGDVIIGADGAYSALRARLQREDCFGYSQNYLGHGYKELRIPPASECGVDPQLHGGFAMDPNALHIWPRGGSMMIALPNADRSFTCTAFWPYERFTELGDDDDRIRAHFQRVYPDAVPLMPTLLEDYRDNPVGDLVTIRCEPWSHGTRVLLLGDAAHAIVPFYGQGMNAAFEDVRLLCAMLDDLDDFERVIPAFGPARKRDADAIADMALDNFVEMRDHVGSRVFLAKKRTEQFLHWLLWFWYRPLYNMVSFQNVPYAQARALARRQAGWVWVGVATLVMLALGALSFFTGVMSTRLPLWAFAGLIYVIVVWLKGPHRAVGDTR